MKLPKNVALRRFPGTVPERPQGVGTPAPPRDARKIGHAFILEGKLLQAVVNVFHLIGDGGAGRIGVRLDYFFTDCNHHSAPINICFSGI